MPTPKGAPKAGLPNKIVSMPGKAFGISRHGMRLLVGVVVLLVAFLIGYSLGAVQTKQSYEKGLSDGWENARQKVADSGLLPSPQINILSGTVTEVGTDYLKIEVPQIVINPLEQQAPTSRKVTIGQDTVIEMATQFTDDERDAAQERFLKLQEDYFEAVQSGDTTATPPDPNLLNANIEEIDLADIENGMSVSVTSAEDIATAATFAATSVRVQAAVQPTAPPPGGNVPAPPGA